MAGCGHLETSRVCKNHKAGTVGIIISMLRLKSVRDKLCIAVVVHDHLGIIVRFVISCGFIYIIHSDIGANIDIIGSHPGIDGHGFGEKMERFSNINYIFVAIHICKVIHIPKGLCVVVTGISIWISIQIDAANGKDEGALNGIAGFVHDLIGGIQPLTQHRHFNV